MADPMIDLTETTTTQTRSVYKITTPDGSIIEAARLDDVVTITYAGLALPLPLGALSALTALTATVGAAAIPVPDPAPLPGIPPVTH